MHFSLFSLETALLSLKFSGVTVADTPSPAETPVRLAMACTFFGGLTNVSWLATA